MKNALTAKILIGLLLSTNLSVAAAEGNTLTVTDPAAAMDATTVGGNTSYSDNTLTLAVSASATAYGVKTLEDVTVSNNTVNLLQGQIESIYGCNSYYGAAYEYEFAGSAEATYKGMNTLSPSLKGSSGMAELGWRGKSSEDSPMTADLSLKGWTGKKQGWNINAKLAWEF